MYLFFKSLIVFFATFRAGISERILSTFVKANRLSFISESYSAGPKLLGYKFLSRLS